MSATSDAGGPSGTDAPAPAPGSTAAADHPTVAEGAGGGARRWPTVAAWCLLGALTAHLVALSLTHDYRDGTLVGDQASFLMQALSLAEDGDLAYDAADVDRFTAVGWRRPGPAPFGLFFQRHVEGWAFAKPYGYSLVAAPAVALIGAPRGFAVTNTALLLGLLATVVLILRLRLRGPAVPLVAAALVVMSSTKAYAFVLYTELFLALAVAVAVYGLLRAARTGDRWALLLGAAAAAVAVAEKPPVAVALAPLALVALLHERRPLWRAGAVATGVGVLLVVVLPYAVYGTGWSTSPYGGERYVSPYGRVPFSDPPGPAGSWNPANTENIGEPGYVIDQLDESWSDKAVALATYVFGRHTGLLVFMPMALVAVALALWQWRTWDRVGLAVGLGLLAYVLFYVVVFTDNYFGGDQSFGNRYFVQVSPLVAALVVAVPVPARRLAWGAVASLAAAVLLMGPGLLHPADAVERIERTSPLQRLLPFEYRQRSAIRFACGTTTPEDERVACEQEFEAAHG